MTTARQHQGKIVISRSGSVAREELKLQWELRQDGVEAALAQTLQQFRNKVWTRDPPPGTSMPTQFSMDAPRRVGQR
jgi:hypothetical protein